MTNPSEGFLDIIGLEENTREKSKLKVLIDNKSADANKEILVKIFDYIKTIYRTDKSTVLWWEGGSHSNPSTKIVSIEDIEFLHNLWERIVGNYLLFLPEQFEVTKFHQKEKDEEVFIGLCLVTYSQLIIKSPDGYEVLYLFLNK
ncbi:hypothetical protein [Bacillus tianshenii]|uniref:hypothetical protein n=1 Tax=Sutcliffiella tianshenii TaxID=1463404 RepID=UPI001959BF55|nr:hypothetical protein [Bacillus tianshenii]